MFLLTQVRPLVNLSLQSRKKLMKIKNKIKKSSKNGKDQKILISVSLPPTNAEIFLIFLSFQRYYVLSRLTTHMAIHI